MTAATLRRCLNSATGISVAASGTTSWSCSVDLIGGDNAINVTARDAANNGGNDAITITYTAPNPAPSISSVSPVNVTAGGSGFTLTVDGSGFIASSVVSWNGAAHQTSFVSATRLTAAVTSGDIITPGSASVTVTNPTPGGGTSNAATVIVQQGSTDCPAMPVTACPFTTSRSLSASSCTAGKRGASFYTDVFSFTSSQGTAVAIDLTSAVFDTYLYLVAPDGTIAATNDDSNGTTNSQIVTTLSMSGTWTVQATSYFAGDVGAYTLTINFCPTPLGTPSGVLVTYNHQLFGTTPGVNVSWNGVAGATDYEADVNGFILDLQSTATTAGIYGFSEPVCYVVRIRAVNGFGQRSGWSGRELASSASFSEDPLFAGSTVVRSAHFRELRVAVNTVRSAAGMSDAIYSDAVTPGDVVRAADLIELRNALNDALNVLGITNVVFPNPVSGASPIRAADVQLLRQATK